METSYTNKTNLQQAVPFFSVSNMNNSLRFYKDGLGFEIMLSWIPKTEIEWCNLQRDGVNLMLQEFKKGTNVILSEVLPGQGVSICIMCHDALSLYHEFLSKGIEVEEPFVGNGLWVVGLTDPDGYKLFFESATNVPEQTTYTESKNAPQVQQT